MKSILFSVFILGMLLMCLSLFLANIYILGIAEILTIGSTILLIRLNIKLSK